MAHNLHKTINEYPDVNNLSTVSTCIHIVVNIAILKITQFRNVK